MQTVIAVELMIVISKMSNAIENKKEINVKIVEVT